MKVQFWGPDSPALLAMACAYKDRGDVVLRSESLAADADVYYFYAGHEGIRHLARGLVVLDLLDDANLESGQWSAHADLCLVASGPAREALTKNYGCEPERVFVIDGEVSVPDLVDRARREALPPAVVERQSQTAFEPRPVPGQSSPSLAGLETRLEAIERRADVMQRGYQVRSRIPLFGPLVAFVRRNATSHLREPYLDPTLERQVALNRDLIALLRELLCRQADLEARLAELEDTRHE